MNFRRQKILLKYELKFYAFSVFTAPKNNEFIAITITHICNCEAAKNSAHHQQQLVFLGQLQIRAMPIAITCTKGSLQK